MGAAPGLLVPWTQHDARGVLQLRLAALAELALEVVALVELRALREREIVRHRCARRLARLEVRHEVALIKAEGAALAHDVLVDVHGADGLRLQVGTLCHCLGSKDAWDAVLPRAR